MRKHKADYFIVLTTLALMAVGLVVIFAIGPQRANFLNSALGVEKYSENYFFVHQLVSVGLSIVAFFVASKLPVKFLHKYAKWIMLLALFLNVLLAGLALMKSSLAICQLGGCRWIGTAGFSFQPAEFLKIALVIYLADLMARRKEEGELESFWGFWWPFALVSGLSLFFVVILQKDLGTGLTIVAIVLSMLFMSGVKLRYFAAAVGVLGFLGVMSIVISPHRMERLSTFRGNGDSDSSYHIDNALLAIGTGGLFGVGVGNSVQATGYLPESINDSVFAVMGETFGFFGLLLLILAFTFLLMRLLKMIPFLDDEKGIMVAGVFGWIMAQVVVNIAAMTGLIPLTGITLPLLSYGGTSMMFVAYALGLSLQCSSFTSRRPASSEDALLLRRTKSTAQSGAPSSSHGIREVKLGRGWK
ncbi:FtsW/RodA/SpoVE family cell cycle protein [Candidatus Saccharibacteria bacterium]|nr:FtsW/RodA/SpoVE family cell cycle protein [Candidatus Saccharibacteria bacterium]